MNAIPTPENQLSETTRARAAELFTEQRQNIIRHTDKLFGFLMICQWVAAMAAAILISPRTWKGTQSEIHVHVYAAIFLGGIITILPVVLAFARPGKPITRHTIAIAQMLMSALLIHLTGGRIETHFHVFGSLAILAFYRDWRVLISATVVVYVDHLARGAFWPRSVYGVLSAPVWRSLEHAGWVVFEVTFLLLSIRQSLGEMLKSAERQARLEATKEGIEQTVFERTEELRRENSDRKLAEEQLTRSQAQLRKAQKIARLGSWEWDAVEDRVTWSEEMMDLYGFNPSEAGSSMPQSLNHVHPDDREKVRLALESSLRTAQPYACDHRSLLPDGSVRAMRGRAEMITDPDGRVIKMIGTAQDVTETQRAEEALRHSEEQLRQAQKMEAVGRLAGGVAHDFNNLLTVINGYCALSLQKMGADHTLQKNFEEIESAAERAAGLTAQLLAFSRKQVLKPRVLNLNSVVSGMEKMLRRVIGEDIELSTTFDSALGNVKADPGQIEQVILNMAVNARDAMPRGGKLTIRTGNVALDEVTRMRNRDLEVGDYVMLAISDTGVGMTDSVQEHLFEPFFTTKGVGRGTGLGLATCYGIVCQSDGDIRVYSEPNRGTTFKVYLPRVDATVPAVGKKVAPMPAGTESVLIVEDEDAVRRLSTSVLRDCGYKVEHARDGAEALAMVNEGMAFDLIVTDVIMPKMSGRELHDRLKSTRPDIKVLFMSGYTDDALAVHGMLDSEFAFIEKPFSPSRLACKVRETIDTPVPQTELAR
jgi:PAS domain S-box-containing protein